MKAFFKSFTYATDGLLAGIKGERNLRFHLVASAYVIWLGFMYELSQIQWMLLVITMGLVISSELINTAIELTWEKLEPNHCEHVGLVKDIAAAAVLTNAVVAVIIGLILFFDIDKIGKIGVVLIQTPVFLIMFIISLIISYLFIFNFRKK